MMDKIFSIKIHQTDEPFCKLPQPSEEAIIESKILIERLEEEVNNETTEKVQKDILLCHIGQ